ncbi:MAG: hypothetical protein ABSG67_22610 [Thermoguttaceae bacterium]
MHEDLSYVLKKETASKIEAVFLKNNCVVTTIIDCHPIYSSVVTMKNINKVTESSATKYLKWFFYNGCAKFYLGWRYEEVEILPDFTEIIIVPAGARIWPTPTDDKRIRWNPVWDHLKGLPRGVCRGRNEKYLPFVSVDLDRHDGSIPAKQHIYNVLKTGRLLRKHYGNLRWLVEVNPLNGSTKYFGFKNRPIPVAQANDISANIHRLLIDAGLGKREVFPYNSPQVFLPFRTGKTTIIDMGILGKCNRRRRNGDYKYELFEAYSAVAFVKWLQSGTHYNEQILYNTLIRACNNLPDIAEAEPIITNFETDTTPIKSVIVVDDEKDSFKRQREALLVFCRRNRRVVTVDEALTFIRQNNLFSGRWEDNYNRRRSRVESILHYISQTFDPALCNVHYDIKVGKYDAWAKRHCPKGWRSPTRHRVDEYGLVTEIKDRTVADWHFVSIFLSVVEYCLLQDKNADNSLPHVRAEELWDLLLERGIINVSFCPRKWKIVRDVLERLGLITVNHIWFRDQAMCWEVGLYFPGLGSWKGSRVRGLLEPGSLEELIGRGRERGHNSYLQQKINNFPTFNPVSRGPPFSVNIQGSV